MDSYVTNQFNSNPLLSQPMQYQQSNIQYSQPPVTVYVPPIPFGYKKCGRVKGITKTGQAKIDEEKEDELRYCGEIKELSLFHSGRGSCKLCFNKYQKLTLERKKEVVTNHIQQVESEVSKYKNEVNVLINPNNQSEVARLFGEVKEKESEFENLKSSYQKDFNELQNKYNLLVNTNQEELMRIKSELEQEQKYIKTLEEVNAKLEKDVQIEKLEVVDLKDALRAHNV